MRRFLFPLTLLLFSCQGINSPLEDRIQVLSWNLQNLFDDQWDGAEYPEYTPEAGWDHNRYHDRLEELAQALRGLDSGLPDILCFQEVENRRVLEDLAEYLAWPEPYLWMPQTSGPNAPAFLSRFPIEETAILSHRQDGLGLRPMAEAQFFREDRQLRIWNVHWKSRLPSPEATEGLRRDQARLLAFRMRTLAPTPVDESQWLLLGDFNSWPAEPSARDWGTFGPGVWGAGYAPGQEGGLAQWSEDLMSYQYQGEWFPLDHIFYTLPLQRPGGWRVEEVQVLAIEPFLKDGRINRYLPWAGRGLSDHLPLLCTLVFDD
jgi:endonuclease/exonuclease/phosphatase family metal-dependent hydrolase